MVVRPRGERDAAGVARLEPVPLGEPLDSAGVTDSARAAATVFELSGLAPFRPSHTENSNIMRSTCERVSGAPIRYSGCASACTRHRSRKKSTSS